VLLDYVDTMTRLPKLLEQVAAENEEAETMIDGAQAATIDDLAKRIPRIIGLLPDIFFRSRSTDDRHPAAVEEMTKDLLKLAERANPDLLVSIDYKFLLISVFSPFTRLITFVYVVSSSTANPGDVRWGN
jgi:nuclear pore complex protein Nup98-Nup96